MKFFHLITRKSITRFAIQLPLFSNILAVLFHNYSGLELSYLLEVLYMLQLVFKLVEVLVFVFQVKKVMKTCKVTSQKHVQQTAKTCTTNHKNIFFKTVLKQTLKYRPMHDCI